MKDYPLPLQILFLTIVCIIIGGGILWLVSDDGDDDATQIRISNSVSANNKPSPDEHIGTETTTPVQDVAKNHAEAQQMSKPTHGAYYLSSIIYTDPKNWAIWVNDQRLTHDVASTMKGLNIIKVTPEYAECELPSKQKICLKCHHTLNLANGSVYHGDHREALDDALEDDQPN
ncbi:MAG: hypothetical protein Q8K36_00415 [Alphaproteobacteria bacterium]|nr:hypothetical protein [Alphaproteobacteria bacterium]